MSESRDGIAFLLFGHFYHCITLFFLLFIICFSPQFGLSSLSALSVCDGDYQLDDVPPLTYRNQSSFPAAACLDSSCQSFLISLNDKVTPIDIFFLSPPTFGSVLHRPDITGEARGVKSPPVTLTPHGCAQDVQVSSRGFPTCKTVRALALRLVFGLAKMPVLGSKNKKVKLSTRRGFDTHLAPYERGRHPHSMCTAGRLGLPVVIQPVGFHTHTHGTRINCE